MDPNRTTQIALKPILISIGTAARMPKGPYANAAPKVHDKAAARPMAMDVMISFGFALTGFLV